MPLTQQGLSNVQVEPDANRKRAGRTVIGHISDLHFRSGTDTKTRVWEALREDLQRNEIDLLAVTGDVIDNSIRDNLSSEAVKGAFQAAYSYLTATLCRYAKSLASALGLPDLSKGDRVDASEDE